MDTGKILVIGASGQVGIELVLELGRRYGKDQVIASDIRETDQHEVVFEKINVMDRDSLVTVINKHQIKTVYMLAAMLSANGEKKPLFAWDLNMTSLFNVLNLAKDGIIDKIFWPSSIGVFGPSTPKLDVPQRTITEPTTVYGISKLAGERWCEYYNQHFGVDVRSVRFPGLIGYRSLPGGGTTDYAVDIFYKALEQSSYCCFLESTTRLPMMYMEDAINAAIEIMEAPIENIKIRSSYNLSAMSFSPEELACEIKKQLPDFEISYAPDERQSIAESWPQSIDDSNAQKDWNWQSKYDIKSLVLIMIKELRKRTTNNVTIY